MYSAQWDNVSQQHFACTNICRLELELKRIPEIVKRVKLGISNCVLLHTATTDHPDDRKSGTQNLKEAFNKPPYPIHTLWTASQADEYVSLKSFCVIISTIGKMLYLPFLFPRTNFQVVLMLLTCLPCHLRLILLHWVFWLAKICSP